MILPVMAVIAVVVIGLLLWSQRDGARPIAGNEQVSKEETSAGKDEAPAKTTPTEERADGTSTQEPASAQSASEDEDQGSSADVSAATLDSAFHSNPEDAAARFAGPIRVSGVIASMVMPGRTPTLSMEGRTRFNHMIVNFEPGTREQLAPLAKGQRISVSCNTARGFGGTTVLDGCALD